MRDVMKENAARELFCPLRAAYCRGDACMAWVVSWENNNEGYCAAFRATHEQEIGEGWKKYGRRIMDSRKKLLSRALQAEAERDAALADLERAKRIEADAHPCQAISDYWAVVNERDAARAELERAKAEATVMREALEELVGLMEGVRERDYEPDTFTCQPARRALSGQAGADLLADLARLREIERLAKEYRKVVRDKTAHEEAKPSWFSNEDLEGDYYGKENELWHREEEAKEVFFAALGKEAAE